MAALQYPRYCSRAVLVGLGLWPGPLAITLLHPSKTARPRAGVDELGAD